MHDPAEPRPTPAATARRWSLRGRLQFVAALTAVIGWLSGGAVLYFELNSASGQLFDERLGALAQTVLAFADHELTETATLDRSDPEHEEVALTMDSRYVFQIWSEDGRLLLRSSRARGSTPLAPLASSGFLDVEIDGAPLRVYSTRGNSGATILQIAEYRSRRSAVTPAWGVPMIGLFVLSTLGVGALSGLLIRRAVRAFDESARQLTLRTPNRLVPLDAGEAPREIVPLLDSINVLFARVELALSAERRFAETAAHELRTPLAAVRIQAQVARRARDADQRDAALLALEGSVDRLARLVDQLLALAHLGGLQQAEVLRETIEPRAVAEQIVAELQPLAHSRQVDLDLRFDTCRVRGDSTAIAMLFRNLIANALRHVPLGGTVSVQGRDTAAGVLLTVDDSGPGMSPQALAQQGGRSPGNDADEACRRGGLGLSIVHAVARLHCATVRLGQAPLSGLRVEVQFPPAEQTMDQAETKAP